MICNYCQARLFERLVPDPLTAELTDDEYHQMLLTTEALRVWAHYRCFHADIVDVRPA